MPRKLHKGGGRQQRKRPIPKLVKLKTARETWRDMARAIKRRKNPNG